MKYNFKIKYNCFIFLFSAVLSCKSELEKLDLRNITSHKNYQNSIIDSCKSNESKLNTISLLISEYQSLENNVPRSSNLEFLIARLYGIGATLPFYEVFFDSTQNKFKRKETYENYIDSAVYYNRRALDIDGNHIYSMNNLCLILSTDFINNNKSAQQSFLFNRDSTTFNETVNYIINNFQKFSKLDTEPEKKLSIFITEVGFFLLTLSIDNDFSKGINLSEPVSRERLKKIESCISVLQHQNKFNLLTKIAFEKYKIFYTPYIKKLNRLLESERLEIQFNQIDIRHKYSTVDTEEMIFGQIDIYSQDSYTQGVGQYGESENLIHGRGEYIRNGHVIYFTNSGGISFSGQARIDLVNNKLVITLPTGAVYIQDDDSYYIKNIISTNTASKKTKPPTFVFD